MSLNSDAALLELEGESVDGLALLLTGTRPMVGLVLQLKMDHQAFWNLPVEMQGRTRLLNEQGQVEYTSLLHPYVSDLRDEVVEFLVSAKPSFDTKHLDWKTKLRILTPQRDEQAVAADLESFLTLLVGLSSNGCDLANSYEPDFFVRPLVDGEVELCCCNRACGLDLVMALVAIDQTLVSALESGALLSCPNKSMLQGELAQAAKVGLRAELTDHLGQRVNVLEWFQKLRSDLAVHALELRTECAFTLAGDVFVCDELVAMSGAPSALAQPGTAPATASASKEAPRGRMAEIVSAAFAVGLAGVLLGVFLF